MGVEKYPPIYMYFCFTDRPGFIYTISGQTPKHNFNAGSTRTRLFIVFPHPSFSPIESHSCSPPIQTLSFPLTYSHLHVLAQARSQTPIHSHTDPPSSMCRFIPPSSCSNHSLAGSGNH